MKSPNRPTILLRAGRTLAIGAALAGSLLTFPDAIPWMIGVWLIWHTLLVLRGRPGWVPLVACAAIVAAKGTWPTTGLAAVAIAATGSVALGRLREVRASRDDRRLIAGSLVALWIAWGVMLVDWREGLEASPVTAIDENCTIVCLGDSLTADENGKEGYPEILQRMVPGTVVNLAQPGISIAGAFFHLPELTRLKPGIVVIELGAHDFLRGRSRAAAKADLERIIGAAQGAGAAVILVEIPHDFVFDPWRGLERQLAREHDLTLVPDSLIRSFILNSPVAPPGIWLGGPYLSDDGVHPNENGKRVFAEAIAAAVGRMRNRR